MREGRGGRGWGDHIFTAFYTLQNTILIKNHLCFYSFCEVGRSQFTDEDVEMQKASNTLPKVPKIQRAKE